MSNFNVWVVEDDKTLANLFADTLQDLYTVEIKSTLSEVLASSECPDIIFLDLYLPDSKELGTLVAVRKHFPLAQIVVMTSSNEALDASLKNGANAFLMKSQFRVSRLLEEAANAAIRSEANRIGREGKAAIGDVVNTLNALEKSAKDNSNGNGIAVN